MRSLCSHRSGGVARLSSWRREGTSSHWGEFYSKNSQKIDADFYKKILKWMFRDLGLDKSLSTSECGDLEEYIRGPLDIMFSHRFSWSVSSVSKGNDFRKRRCLYLICLFCQIFLHQRSVSMRPIYSFMKTNFSGKIDTYFCPSLHCNIDIILYPDKR